MSHRLTRAVLGALACTAAASAAALPAAAQSNDPSFNLVNRSGTTIYELYVSPSSQSTWGPDRLGADVLPDGQSFPVRLQAGGECVNDVRVVYQGGRDGERRNVNTCELAEMVFGAQAQGPSQPPGQPPAQPPRAPAQPSPPQQQAGQNPSFNLVNNSPRTINEIYASPSSQNDWGPDRLGANVLPAGQSFAVRLPIGDCVYDVRVVYNVRYAQERRQINTCELTNVTFP